MQPKIFIASSVIAVASAFQPGFMAHQEMKRNLIQARATDTAAGAATGTSGSGAGGGLAACTTGLLSIYSTLPTPPPAILSDASAHPQTDYCNFKTPSSLSSEYASYSSEVVSWYSKNEAVIVSALSECPVLSQFATLVPVCPTALAESGAPSATVVPPPVVTPGSNVTVATPPPGTPTATGTGASGTGSGGSSATGTSDASRLVGLGYAAVLIATFAVFFM